MHTVVLLSPPEQHSSTSSSNRIRAAVALHRWRNSVGATCCFVWSLPYSEAITRLVGSRRSKRRRKRQPLYNRLQQRTLSHWAALVGKDLASDSQKLLRPKIQVCPPRVRSRSAAFLLFHYWTDDDDDDVWNYSTRCCVQHHGRTTVL